MHRRCHFFSQKFWLIVERKGMSIWDVGCSMSDFFIWNGFLSWLMEGKKGIGDVGFYMENFSGIACGTTRRFRISKVQWNLVKLLLENKIPIFATLKSLPLTNLIPWWVLPVLARGRMDFLAFYKVSFSYRLISVSNFSWRALKYRGSFFCSLRCTAQIK